MQIRKGFLAATIATFIGTPVLASDRGSMEDQLACTPDVYRLCSQYVPNENAIVACLKQNVKTLSPDCRRVFTRPDSPANGEQDDD